MKTKINTLDALTFDNRFVRELPVDLEIKNETRQVMGACYSNVLPTPVREPRTVAFAKEVADLLNLSEDVCESEDFAQVFAGNRLAKGMEAYATCYGGHQFGEWAGQLGDGRAINLGEVVNHQKQYWTLQLKGAGKTPYSRRSDGLAVLRSSVREFLCSEAMHHLGVPTTRALSLVLTGEHVVRDMFYDGNPQHEQGAVVCRVAPSFTRFGHFQIFAARDDLTLLKQFVDFTIRTDFPELGEPSTAVYLKWFAEVCRRTADMIVHWQRVGFVHGVMNTDNMSILGLTIDYGPYGWLENFDLDWTPNTTDADIGRYRFGKQARMASWNLAQLANAIIPLIQQIKPLQAILDEHYIQNFRNAWSKMMAEKLGLPDIQETDEALIYDLVALLQTVETDMTLFFRQLAKVDMSQIEFDISPLEDIYYSPEQLDETYEHSRLEWLKRYQQRLHQSEITEAERCKRMNATNPIYVPRNYLVQLAIDAAEQGDFSEIHKLLDVFRSPYDEKSNLAKYAAKRPDWAKERAGCSMLSCSS
ncbi:MAG: YdiU family protein [Methylococcales bacterium]|nr:YdiU family protein [Methylococcales bacterium]